MRDSRKKSRSSVQEQNEETHKIFEDLADLLFAVIAYPQGQEKQDPFDVYVSRIQSHIYSSPVQFKDRLFQGFQVLMREMDRPS